MHERYIISGGHFSYLIMNINAENDFPYNFVNVLPH